MRTPLKYFLAWITPVLSWGLFFFVFYAGFSGKVAFYNRLPGYIQRTMAWSIPIIAVLGAAVCIQIFRQNKKNIRIMARFLVPFLLNLAIIGLLSFEMIGCLLEVLRG